MKDGFSKGDRVLAFAEGRLREMVVDLVTADGRLAQLLWVEGRTERHVLSLVRNLQKVQGPTLVRETAIRSPATLAAAGHVGPAAARSGRTADRRTAPARMLA